MDFISQLVIIQYYENVFTIGLEVGLYKKDIDFNTQVNKFI